MLDSGEAGARFVDKIEGRADLLPDDISEIEDLVEFTMNSPEVDGNTLAKAKVTLLQYESQSGTPEITSEEYLNYLDRIETSNSEVDGINGLLTDIESDPGQVPDTGFEARRIAHYAEDDSVSEIIIEAQTDGASRDIDYAVNTGDGWQYIEAKNVRSGYSSSTLTTQLSSAQRKFEQNCAMINPN